jgi:transcriptional regulator with XRE-family HTH domain
MARRGLITGHREAIPVEPAPSLSSSTFSDQLRAILRRDGRTIYAIETAAGVPRGGVGRFLSGERGLTTDTLDRLAGVLGMRVVGPDDADRSL